MLLGPYGDPLNFLSFVIPGSSQKLTLHYNCTNTGITSFIQFQGRKDEYAGWLNYVTYGGRNEVTKANVEYSVTIASGGNDIAVSFWNPNSSQLGLTVWYNE
jgi:hypothetical protein